MAGVAGGGTPPGVAGVGGEVGTRITRLVLDTNVWLDWLVFDEPALAPLRAAHAAGRVEVVMDDACEAELARVLAYDLGKHTIGADAQAKCMGRCRRIARRIDATLSETAATAASAAAPARAGPASPSSAILPRCRDPHDQKFLELALAAQADVLVTKDQALLELARRKLPFRIAPPQALGAL
ncbi:MAG TPA: PIN domain-containing protein [Burkholderiales bacterium]